MLKIAWTLSVLACLPASWAAQPPGAPTSVGLTIYSSADPAGFDPQRFASGQSYGGYNTQGPWGVPGFGVVKELRTIALQPGANTVKLTNVAQYIDPTTVSFTDLTSASTAVLDQQFVFDLVSSAKLLEKYIDRDITLRVPMADQGVEAITGRLLSNSYSQAVIETREGIRLVPTAQAQIILGTLPEGLITRPTLQWLVTAQVGGPHQVRTTYQTNGITWRADYNLVVNDRETSADLGAWVTLLNLSGATYPNAQLKLIAGDVNRVRPQDRAMADTYAMPAVAPDARAFQEKSFFEYHLYTLPRPTTIADKATQQITLFPTARGVGVEKVLVYFGAAPQRYWYYAASPMLDRQLGIQTNKQVDVYLRFANAEGNRLGMALPRGKVRVFKQDPDDSSLEFIGEDLIGHTPRDETLLIKLGQSFDVVGERTQTDFTLDTAGHVMTETYRIQLRSHKQEAAKVIAKETLFRWYNWQIIRSSDPYEKVDARTIHFTADLPAGSEKTLTYTVRYTW